MAFDPAGGVLTLDPDEVETSPAAKALDPSEVEDAPSPRQNSLAQSASAGQPLPTPQTAGGGSRYEANIPNPLPRLPAGATGPLPAIPQPQVDMHVPEAGGPFASPKGLPEPTQVYNYGQNAIPRAVQGAQEVGRGQYVRGATDLLGGINEGLGSQILPVGSAPAAVAKGIAGSVAGSVAAPYAVRKLGGSPDAQALAGEVGAALPLAAGVGADLLRRPRPEVIPPVRPGSVDVPEAGNLLPAGEPQTINAAPTDSAPNPQPAASNRLMLGSGENSAPDVRYKNGRAFVQDPKTGWWQPQSAVATREPADITVHRAGKVSGIDEATGLPIVDRSQPSEIPFSARGENLPPQTGTAGPMSPEAEAISARAAESSQTAKPQLAQPEAQTVAREQQPERIAYQHYQNLIDQREDELEGQGTDPTKLYFSDNSEHLAGAPGWSPMPNDLENLYRLRDSVGSSQLQNSIGDIQTRLASVGIKDDEAKRILDAYALDPDRTDAAKQYLAAEHAQNAAARPWEEQVRDAYIRLANQRDIPMDDDDDLYRDKKTTRDARNAVEQVISYFHPEDAESPTPSQPGAQISSRTAGPIEGIPEQAGARPVIQRASSQPTADGTDTATQNFGNFLDRVGTRVAMESHGQDILDKMEEAGESPRDVSDKFWSDTYFKLPAAAQQRFTKMLKGVSGFEPGDTIAVRPDKSGIVAQDWADVAKGMLPEKVEHLEGPERGLAALMKEANDRVAQTSNSSQQAAAGPQPVVGVRPLVMPARNPYGATPSAPRYGQVMPVQPALTAGKPAAQLGKSPLELSKSDERGMYAGNHPGNAIVRINGGGAGRESLLPAAPRPHPVLRPASLSSADTGREPAAQAENGKPQPQTMYSGAAIFDPEAWKTLFPDVAERFSDWVNDKQDEGDRQAAIMRETRGELDRKVSIAAKQLEKVQRDFRLRPRQDALDFFNAAEGVTPMSSIPARDQALAATFKGYFDKMKAELQSLNPNVLRDFIENYFPHIWERPSHAASVFQQVLSGKRPFAGSGAFLKQRTIPTIQDGIALGLKPVSYNPVDLFLSKYHEISRFLMAHKTLGMMKDAGTAKLVRPGTAAPDGWTQLDDRIGAVMSTDADGNLLIRGHYYAPAPAAKVFNAYVSKGLAGRSAIFDTLQAANNRLNSLQLGISAFHATTTAVNAAASDIALGTQQLTQGKPLQGLKNLAEGVTYVPSMISTLRNGSKLMKEYLSPGSYAKFAREANAVSLAGGRIRQNTIEIKPLTQALDDLKAGAIASAMKKTIPALIDASSRPIMGQWVPRMKLGAFYDMAHNILDTADREGWSNDQIRTRMQSAWNSIDNRFGQMVYDNLFWNKALRDILMASTRSVGWNAGTIRELGGAAVDTAQQAGKMASGKAPELTDRMAFAIGMTVSAGLMGSAIYYLLNGERPQTWKDAYFPGKKGEARMSIPGYMKDVVAYAHDPKQTILNKMSPVLSMLSAALENRDFYGTEIRHPDDPVVQQLWQLAKFTGSEAVPFSLRGVQKLVQQKGSLETSLPGQVKQALRNPKELIAGQFGFQPAPAYIQNSPALNRAHEYDMANMPPGTRTQEQAEKQRLRSAIAAQYRSGHPDHAAIENLVREGKLTQKEVNAAIVTAKTDPLLRAARPLHLDQLLNVYADADQQERRELRPILTRKAGDLQKEGDPQRRASLRAALQDALRKGSGAQGTATRRSVAMP
jgi:hypothetical protein